MIRLRKYLWGLILISGMLSAQQKQSVPRPKLVVGLIVDQMRWDYLYRYYTKYGEGGFKRLLSSGYSLNNVHIDYVPTVTAIGHTSIFTGSVPSIHGIAGNDWYDREQGKNIYCTADDTVHPIGSSSNASGQHSPRNLWATTITDQLGLETNFNSKIIGISLKDRASILPAGHNPTGAFWFDDTTGKFITSSYYAKELPKWVQAFNAKNIPAQLVANGWSTLLPIQQYTESSPDDVPWENLLGSKKTPTFPYTDLAKDYEAKKGLIRTTPFGNTLSLKLAEAAIEANQMGADEVTDFLTVNLASTDYVGHHFGPNSIEVEDTYLRLDRDLSDFFKNLDAKIGKDNYLVFLTADHGAAHAVEFMRAHKMPAGFFGENNKSKLNQKAKQKFGVDHLIAATKNYQIYLDRKLISDHKIALDEVQNFFIDVLRKDPAVLYAINMDEIARSPVPEPIKSRVINGYNWERSGDIQIIPKDGYLPLYVKKGTTHSVWNSYDSHIPLIFMGWKINQGESNQPYNMTDIAPTLSALLKIQFPSGSIGKPITEVIGK
ncbi:alkaline phosphatase family protein [Elizabethkingia argentiflava]|uniref:Alkaline phosphatase family protein n=1 Tax=Elizabethkingia argenteiflava TaxID=2681556 RepID=A0A845PV41_9FLAO|nr:alkaline phosphatase PafA [Elizabethkingia argenteiflava]NAW50158.1 alkaline phosphatase family protein [Elizabethkingia argenteiflava]